MSKLVIVKFIVLLVGLVSFQHYNNDSFHHYFKTSRYVNIEYNVIVPLPIESQIVDYRESDSIESITPFYRLQATLDQSNVSLYMIDQFAVVNNTNFSDKRLLLSSDQLVTNAAYVDQRFADRFDVKLNDTINLTIVGTEIEYTVLRVYETDNQYVTNDGVVMVESGSVPAVGLEALRYAGAYIVSNDLQTTNTLLQDYQPLGSLLSRDQFDSDEDYQDYLDSFNRIDYSNEITFVPDLIASTMSQVGEANRLFYVLSVLLVTLSFVGYSSMSLLRDKGLFQEALKLGSIESFVSYQNKKNILYESISVGLVIVYFVLFVYPNDWYPSFQWQWIYLIGGLIIGGLVLDAVSYFLHNRKYLRIYRSTQSRTAFVSTIEESIVRKLYLEQQTKEDLVHIYRVSRDFLDGVEEDFNGLLMKRTAESLGEMKKRYKLSQIELNTILQKQTNNS